MELALEEKRLAKEQAVYEAPTVKRQAEIDLEKAERALALASATTPAGPAGRSTQLRHS
jgi:hypothetical protein